MAQAKRLEADGGVEETTDIIGAEAKIMQGEAGEPTESDRASIHELPEAFPIQVELEVAGRSSRNLCPYGELEAVRVAALDGVADGMAEGLQERVYQVEGEEQLPACAGGGALSSSGQQPPRRGGVRRRRLLGRALAVCSGHHVVDVDLENGEQAWDARPSSREGADPDGGAQITQALNDVDEKVVW